MIIPPTDQHTSEATPSAPPMYPSVPGGETGYWDVDQHQHQPPVQQPQPQHLPPVHQYQPVQQPQYPPPVQQPQYQHPPPVHQIPSSPATSEASTATATAGPVFANNLVYSGVSGNLFVPSLTLVPHMVTIRSPHSRHYLCAERIKLFATSVSISCNRSSARSWEMFMTVPLGACTYAFRCYHGPYLSSSEKGALHANTYAIGQREIFTVERHDEGFAVRDYKGRYLHAQSQADIQRTRSLIAERQHLQSQRQTAGSSSITNSNTNSNTVVVTGSRSSFVSSTSSVSSSGGGNSLSNALRTISVETRLAQEDLDNANSTIFAKRLEHPGKQNFFIITPVNHPSMTQHPVLGTGDRQVALLTSHGTLMSVSSKGQLVHVQRPNNVPSSCELFTLMHMGNSNYAFRDMNGTFLCAERKGKVVCNRKYVDSWEMFQCIAEHNTAGQQGSWTIAFKSHHKKFLAAENGGALHARGPQATQDTRFMVMFIPDSRPLPILGRGSVSVSLRLQANGKFLCAEGSTLLNIGKAGNLYVNRSKAKAWERFRFMHQVGNLYSIKNHHGKYLTAESSGRVSAHSKTVGDCERWLVEWYSDGAALRSYFGRYLGADMNSKNYDVVNVGQVAGPCEKFFLTPL